VPPEDAKGPRRRATENVRVTGEDRVSDPRFARRERVRREVGISFGYKRAVTRPRLRRLAVIASLFWARASEADPAVEPVRFVYEAPPGCPTEGEFLDEVRRSVPRMRWAGPEEVARRFKVTIGADGRRGRLTIEKDGAAGVRDVEGATCREVMGLLAFATALAVDPDAVRPSDSSAPRAERPATREPPPGSAPPTSSSPNPEPSVHTAPRTTKTRWSLGGYGFVESAAAPDLTFGAGAAGDLRTPIGPLVPVITFGVGYGTSAPAIADGASVTFVNGLALLEACPFELGSDRAGIRPCVRMEGGVRRTTGHDIPRARGVTRPWLSLGASAHARWVVARPFFVEIGGAVLFPTVQDRVYLEPGFTVHEVPWIGGLGEIRVGVEFRDQTQN
jgi:cell division septation protein DedD